MSAAKVVPLTRNAPGTDLAAFVGGVALGLDLPPGLLDEEWAALGSRLDLLTEAGPWCVGDWIAYRMRVVVGGKPVIRAARAVAVEAKAHVAHLSVALLAEAGRVARAFPRPKRRTLLSWKVHRIVHAVKREIDRDALLDWAEAPAREGLPVKGATAVRRHGQKLGLIPRKATRRVRPRLPPLDKDAEGAVRLLESWVNQGTQIRDFFKGGEAAAGALRACESWLEPDHVGPLGEFLQVIEGRLRELDAP